MKVCDRNGEVMGCRQGFQSAPPWLMQNTIMLSLAGSRLYGTSTETSDWDYRGVCVPPDSYVYGLDMFEQYQTSQSSGIDLCIYSLRKFAVLCLKCNPNVLEILWSPPEKHVIHHELWNLLYKERQSFLSKQAFRSFSGYAMSQLYKVRKAYEATGEYDPKHAMHLIRLMRMGVEVLRDGEVIVEREDADYLLEIREGKVPFQEIIDKHNKIYEALLDLRDSSSLPDKPDYDTVNRIVMKITKMSLLGKLELEEAISHD